MKSPLASVTRGRLLLAPQKRWRAQPNGRAGDNRAVRVFDGADDGARETLSGGVVAAGERRKASIVTDRRRIASIWHQPLLWSRIASNVQTEF